MVGKSKTVLTQRLQQGSVLGERQEAPVNEWKTWNPGLSWATYPGARLSVYGI